LRFNHPNRVFDSWKKWKAEQAGFDLKIVKKPSAIAKLKEVNIELQEKLYRVEQELARGGGDLWTPEDTAENIASVMLGMLTSVKAERVARTILAKVKEKKKSAPPKSAAQDAAAFIEARKVLHAAKTGGAA
jgi:hypothetical protein